MSDRWWIIKKIAVKSRDIFENLTRIQQCACHNDCVFNYHEVVVVQSFTKLVNSDQDEVFES